MKLKLILKGLRQSGRARSKGQAAPGRPAGEQAISPALYQQIRQAVRELTRPSLSAAHPA